MADKNISEMIREALDAGVTKPVAITAWVQEKYSTEVKKSLINNVKQRYKKNKGNTEGTRRRGRPAKNAAQTLVVSSAAQVESEGKSHSELIRLALEGGVLKPAKVIGWVKETYGVDVGRGLVNQVKHKWANGNGRKRLGARTEKHAVPTPAAAVAAKSPAAKSPANGDLRIEDIVSVKTLVGRLGKASLTKLIDVL
ncbi:MAG: hypothetical protein K2X38_02890 [Gemmataceae bacterium]|nr:hypothetical protein [Gemmataceae bacterium]